MRCASTSLPTAPPARTDRPASVVSIRLASDFAGTETVPLLIIGAGACGLCAALAAGDAGVEAIAIERDPVPRGSTALSSGLIPAAATAKQREKGIADSADLFAADIRRKNHGEADPLIVDVVARASGPTVDWLAERHAVELDVLDDFLYPGHSVHRMHGTKRRTGEELMAFLSAAAERAGVTVMTSARCADLFADGDGRIVGVAIARPDGSVEHIGCQALILACNGYGGNKALLHRHIPAMEHAHFAGHVGNQGDAILWGDALGAAIADLGAFQGHGSVAEPHGVLITWAVMAEGGFQVNREGVRFSNEHRGYSEQALSVLAQPGGVAFDIYDRRLHMIARQFEDYRQAEDARAVRHADTIETLARALHLPELTLARTLAETRDLAAGRGSDAFGRDFTTKPPLQPPFYGVRVTGSLFHTQGGLVIDADARVLRPDATGFPNLFAGGGAARGVSGSGADGYLSGNGLLTATTLGRIAGTAAARQILAGR